MSITNVDSIRRRVNGSTAHRPDGFSWRLLRVVGDLGWSHREKADDHEGQQADHADAVRPACVRDREQSDPGDQARASRPGKQARSGGLDDRSGLVRSCDLSLPAGVEAATQNEPEQQRERGKEKSPRRRARRRPRARACRGAPRPAHREPGKDDRPLGERPASDDRRDGDRGRVASWLVAPPLYECQRAEPPDPPTRSTPATRARRAEVIQPGCVRCSTISPPTPARQRPPRRPAREFGTAARATRLRAEPRPREEHGGEIRGCCDRERRDQDRDWPCPARQHLAGGVADRHAPGGDRADYGAERKRGEDRGDRRSGSITPSPSRWRPPSAARTLRRGG